VHPSGPISNASRPLDGQAGGNGDRRWYLRPKVIPRRFHRQCAVTTTWSRPAIWRDRAAGRGHVSDCDRVAGAPKAAQKDAGSHLEQAGPGGVGEW